MANKPFPYGFFRSIPHANAGKKMADRTKDDNAENEYTSETFHNRKGKNLPDAYSDISSSMAGKKEPKKNKGLRKYKGLKSIRKINPDEEIGEGDDSE